jgi:hypothetical protein
MPVKIYKLCLSQEEYQRFHTDPETRLYVHSWNGVELSITTGTSSQQLVKDISKVVDFGATSAGEVLGILEYP